MFVTDDPYRDFVEDVHLSNYQRMSGVELLAEKQMKEKKNHSHRGKRSELPRFEKIIIRHCFQHIFTFYSRFFFFSPFPRTLF